MDPFHDLRQELLAQKFQKQPPLFDLYIPDLPTSAKRNREHTVQLSCDTLRFGIYGIYLSDSSALFYPVDYFFN